MNKPTKLTAAGALIAIAAALGVLLITGVVAGATGGVPDPAGPKLTDTAGNVATIDKVGDIPKSGPNGFNHWYVIVNNSQNAQQGAKAPKKKAPPEPDTPAGQALKSQVMSFLITADWIAGEAQQRGLDVTPAEVTRQFEQTKKQSFPTEAGYKKFLKQSGQNEQDVRYRVRLEVLSNKIKEAVTKGTDKISDSEISDYYDSNKKQFSQPEQRDIQQVVTKDKAKADQAYKALQSGDSFAAVVKKYSTDPTSKTNGGKLQGVTKGTQDPALDSAVFAGVKGKVVAPVKTAQGYVVFKVTKIQKGTQQTLAQSKSGIKQLLVSQKQQEALNNFQEDFKNTWRSRTLCAPDYLVPECGNGRSTSGQPTPPKTPTPPGQKKPVPGASGTAPAALDNPDPTAAAGAPAAPAEVTDPSGPQPLAYKPSKPAQDAAAGLGGAAGAAQGLPTGAAGGASSGLPAALGGAPSSTPAAAGGLPQGLPQGIPQGAGGAQQAPPPSQ